MKIICENKGSDPDWQITLDHYGSGYATLRFYRAGKAGTSIPPEKSLTVDKIKCSFKVYSIFNQNLPQQFESASGTKIKIKCGIRIRLSRPGSIQRKCPNFQLLSTLGYSVSSSCVYFSSCNF